MALTLLIVNNDHPCDHHLTNLYKELLPADQYHVESSSLDHCMRIPPHAHALILPTSIATSLTTKELRSLSHFPLLRYEEGPMREVFSKNHHAYDGLLFPEMSSTSIQITCLNAMNSYHLRKNLQQEIEKLTHQLEERRWVEQAKSILQEARNISEQEAYRFLRKRAMDERRRLPEVAVSLIQFHKMLEDPKEAEPIR
ncbi:ANTAR domain-containing response regulator [Marininema halotolerans]|uniref:ANTAR domain-containing protein n=1 Tax=Marininema halotolerans TaxID=1155944 RepID=A0A1I6UJ45_9BACL|nr:ANTAR domain-containing protein [Marininema halotolerans]SFT01448.1 ANTAR domain-containing protein [Marininema halotolerans]